MRGTVRPDIDGGRGQDYNRIQPDGARAPVRPPGNRGNQQKWSVRRLNMKIAVTYENGQVFQHFGHSEAFKIYETENGGVVSSRVVGTAGSGHGALAGFLREQGVEALICGGIGGGARTALAEAGIKLYPGVTGGADESVAALLAGSLAYNPDTMCNHHHEEGHVCGDHGCGGHH